MSILEKPLKGLSSSEYETLQKPLGKRIPYPMMGLGYVVGQRGERKLTRYLGVLDRPLMVTSERDLDEVEGRLLRDMPTPEMLPLFFKVMSAIDPQNKRRAMLLIGAPGAGKTFLGELAGNVSHEKGSITIDCTGMSLYELFFETVLDFNGDKSFYNALNAKIEKYNALVGDKDAQDKVLNPLSVDTMKRALGEAFSQDSGKICIDWSRVKHAHRDKDGELMDSAESTRIAREGLDLIREKEGLSSGAGNALGMATQAGPAWQAYKEGRVLILDELNRAKRGTFGILHRWMQFMIGEIPSCRIRNPLKEKGDQTQAELFFTRDEMGAGCYVFGTSNKLEDSDEVLELPEALSSRLVPEEVPKATLRGWQHRLCQILTGLPVSTIYEAQRDVWDQDPEAFGQQLLEWRMQREDREVPEHQMNMLRRWKDVLQATQHLAEFLDSAAKVVDPDSDWHKAGTLQQLLDDISESFKKEVSVDFRKINYFIDRAFQAKPYVRPPKTENGPEIVPLIGEMDMPETQDDIRHKLGTHMTYVIMDWIIGVSEDRGKSDLGNQLMRIAADCALIDPQLVEGMPTTRRTVAELLDENPYDSPDADIRLALVRNLMCDYLRSTHDEVRMDNESVMPLSAVRRAIEAVAGQEGGLLVFNDDLGSAIEAPIQKASSVDMTPAGDEGKVDSSMAPSADRLLSKYALLATLAAPKLRDHNLKGLWNDALSQSGVTDQGPEDLNQDSLAIAENRSDSGMAVTTVMVRDDAGAAETALHVIWNKELDRVLVVGEGDISASLKRAFNDARVAYVDRAHEDAEKVLHKGLGFVMGDSALRHEESMRKAFRMRNRVIPQSFMSNDEINLAKMMLNENLECFLPHYLVKKDEADHRPAPSL
ncbi:MAG: hypothetical protein H6867_04230 [Rhodospirillales bacterium]|nr:hypothetical protein [Rhodospirillales bacterium]MCB9996357.1 hypothetical protein [Rhodospirillales bacterium]